MVPVEDAEVKCTVSGASPATVSVPMTATGGVPPPGLAGGVHATAASENAPNTTNATKRMRVMVFPSRTASLEPSPNPSGTRLAHSCPHHKVHGDPSPYTVRVR